MTRPPDESFRWYEGDDVARDRVNALLARYHAQDGTLEALSVTGSGAPGVAIYGDVEVWYTQPSDEIGNGS